MPGAKVLSNDRARPAVLSWVMLAAIDIGLKVILGDGAVKVRPSMSQSAESLSFNLSATAPIEFKQPTIGKP